MNKFVAGVLVAMVMCVVVFLMLLHFVLGMLEPTDLKIAKVYAERDVTVTELNTNRDVTVAEIYANRDITIAQEQYSAQKETSLAYSVYLLVSTAISSYWLVSGIAGLLAVVYCVKKVGSL